MTRPAKSAAMPSEIEGTLREREQAEAALDLALQRWTHANERYLALRADKARRERALREREQAEAALDLALQRWTHANERCLALRADKARGQWRALTEVTA